MSILDHNHSYGSPMDYKENPSAHLNGKFFWFSGYYNIGIRNMLAYDETHNDETDAIVNKPILDDVDDPPLDDNPADDIHQNVLDDDEIDHNINVVNELIAELAENEVEGEEDKINCSFEFDVSHEPENYTYNIPEDINNSDGLIDNSTETVCNEVIPNDRNNEDIPEKTKKCIPVSTLWFRYNDDLDFDKPLTTQKSSPLGEHLTSGFDDDSPPLIGSSNTDAVSCQCPIQVKLPDIKMGDFENFEDESVDGVNKSPVEIVNVTQFVDDKLISTIEDLLTEVNANSPSVHESFEKPLENIIDVPPVEENNFTAEIPSLEFLEKALAEIEKDDLTLPGITEDITVLRINDVESENMNGHLFIDDNIPNGGDANIDNINDEEDTDEIPSAMDFGGGVFFKLHVEKPKHNHETVNVCDHLEECFEDLKEDIPPEECLKDITMEDLIDNILLDEPIEDFKHVSSGESVVTQLEDSKYVATEEGEIKLKNEILPEITENITVIHKSDVELESNLMDDLLIIENHIPVEPFANEYVTSICDDNLTLEIDTNNIKGELPMDIEAPEVGKNVDANDNMNDEEYSDESFTSTNFCGGIFFKLHVSNMKCDNDFVDITPLEQCIEDLQEDVPSNDYAENSKEQYVPPDVCIDDLKGVHLEECNGDIKVQEDLSCETLSEEYVEDNETLVEDLTQVGNIYTNVEDIELNIDIFPGLTEDDFTQQDVNKDINYPIGEETEHFKDDDESYRVGTWFGFAGRTYRTTPMENLLDIDAIDDVHNEENNCIDSVSSRDSIIDDHTIFDLDFRNKNLSEVSEISELSDDSLEGKSSVDTQLTIVTPLYNDGNTGLLKLYQESSFDDEVFVDSKIDEIINCVKASHVFSVPEEPSPYNDQVVEEPCFYYDHISEEKGFSMEQNNKEISVDEKNTENEIQLSKTVTSKDDFQVVDDYNYVSIQTTDLVEIDNKVELEEENIEDEPRPDKEDMAFIKSYLADSTKTSSNLTSDNEFDSIKANLFENNKPNLNKLDSYSDDSICNEDSFVEVSDEEPNAYFERGTSFRRSIVIQDEVTQNHHRQSSGGVTHVSAFYFTPISPQSESDIVPEQIICKQAKELLNYLDNIIISDETFGRDFEVIKRLHALFWELKDGHYKNNNNQGTLSSVLNYMVVQEWPKVFVGVFRKLKAAFPHVFQEHDTEVC